MKRTRSGIVSKLCKEVGITRDMALFMLKDMKQYKIADIEPKYMNRHLTAKNACKNKPGKRRPKKSVARSDELGVSLLDEVGKLPGE